MLLRRFSKHVTDQNWFAVGLDVLVVIAGIFLGMQVTEWNDERKNKDAERTIIKRISAETNSGLKVIDSYLALHNQLIKRGLGLIQKLDKDKTCDLSDQELSDGLIRVASFPPLDFEFMILDELVESGRVILITDADVRGKLASIRSNLNLVKHQWERYSRTKGETASVAVATAGAVIVSDSNFYLDKNSIDTMSFRTPEMLCGNYRVIGQMSNAVTVNIAYRAYLNRYRTALLDWQLTINKYTVVIK